MCCVFVCVSERVGEQEREGGRERERGGKGNQCVCVKDAVTGVRAHETTNK